MGFEIVEGSVNITDQTTGDPVEVLPNGALINSMIDHETGSVSIITPTNSLKV